MSTSTFNVAQSPVLFDVLDNELGPVEGHDVEVRQKSSDPVGARVDTGHLSHSLVAPLFHRIDSYGQNPLNDHDVVGIYHIVSNSNTVLSMKI